MGKKVGFVAIIGLPNAGKSTLLNTILKEKISIVSPRPQTTRYRIEGIYTTENAQIIFVDTPGFVTAEKGLNHILENEILEAIDKSDLILLIIEPSNVSLIKEGYSLFENFKKKVYDSKKPLVIALNKSDLLDESEKKRHIEILKESGFENIVPISALKQENIDSLINTILTYLPEGEFLYDPDQIAIKSERFLAQEMIREQLFYLLKKEIPYECAVTIEEFDESDRYNEKQIVRIRAIIYVSRESLKPIIIGNNGSMIKRIGTLARENLERFLGSKVYLDLRVLVKKKWNQNRYFLSDLGYSKV